MSLDTEMEGAPPVYVYEHHHHHHHSSDLLHIDDLLDFSNEEIFDTSSSDASSHRFPPPLESSLPSSEIPDVTQFRSQFEDLSIPCEDVEELEWLSNFVEESFSDLPFPDGGGDMAGSSSSWADGRARGKRSRPSAANGGGGCMMEGEFSTESGKGKGGGRRKEAVSGEVVVRKCSHCATEKTPQWRTGPMGPKSLCNACGVRYKSGRLVPEYRPAASPTFVLTQHSNSHRKVMELRRQKEVLRQDSFHDFKVC
ncbi:hypothetical protein MRB53_025497 [Persea americana]|uniref:Uncharacterized protein n=1 Tax=Persea americana TaxID=3435 RepID=A0ACC2LFF5_PERAE|nr:hypothetical protein MRB53_025497 [Persea americana]